MKECDVRKRAFAMPLTSPAYPPGPYRFRQREYLVIAYRTDQRKLRELVPEPLRVEEPVVKYEFTRMPDSTGFGDYTESGQVIPVSVEGGKGEIFIGDVEEDESTKQTAVQISVPMLYNKEAIGVLVIGVKVSVLEAEKLKAGK